MIGYIIAVTLCGLIVLGVIAIAVWGAIRGEPSRPFEEINKKHNRGHSGYLKH